MRRGPVARFFFHPATQVFICSWIIGGLRHTTGWEWWFGAITAIAGLVGAGITWERRHREQESWLKIIRAFIKSESQPK